MVSFAAQRVGHPVFRGTRPLSRGSLKSKDGGNTTKHNNAEPQTAELLLRPFLPSISSVISDQLRIGVKISLSDQEIILHEARRDLLANVSICNSGALGDLVQERDEKFKHFPDDV